MPGLLVHAILALILSVSVALALKLSLQNALFLIFIALFSSSFPDVDIKTSIFRISLEKVAVLISCFALIFFLLFRDVKFVWLVLFIQLLLLALYFTKHRTLFHNPFLAILLFILFYLPFNDFLFGIVASAAFLLHLAADKAVG
ncbi:hypothetical protein DRJ19_00270 [Candidatus Woesearchaeota archaeon]|nr:MAG: hypothetical protein DRJ19_00270 [Candidatus Woesearchaeota archaeon]